MTDRQNQLVSYLLVKNEPLTQLQVLRDLADVYEYIEDGKPYHDSLARHKLTADIHELKLRGEAYIISTNRGIRLGSDEENIRYHRRLLANLKKRIALEYIALRNFGLEGQFNTDGTVKEAVANG